jgi:hypothetical protein
MKSSEKELLSALKDKNINAPLENIRNETGELRHIIGIPKFKGEISLIITSTFLNITAPNPAIVILPAALPAGLAVNFPVYLFGLTDFFGGFNKFNNILPVGAGWQIIVSEIVTPALQNQLIIGWLGAYNPVIGDLLIVLQNVTLPPPVYICIIAVHCNNVAYGTFLHSFVSDIIVLNMLRYIVPIANINQLINPIIFGYQSLFGKFKTDTIDARTFVTTSTFQQQIADIPINLAIDKNIMIGTHLNFDCQFINFILSVNKIKPFKTN